MITLFAMWTPGPLELMFILILLFAFVLTMAVTRWIFRINKRIELLSQILNELKKLNARG